MENNTQGKVLGVVALGGSLPLSLAEWLAKNSTPFHCVGFEGVTSPGIKRYPFTEVSYFKIGQLFQALRRNGCDRIVFAGQLFRPSLFKMRFDATTLRYLPLLLFARTRGDDTVLRKVTRAFEGAGFQVLSMKDVAPALVAQSGPLGLHSVPESLQQDVDDGFAILEQLGRHDVGQALVIDRGRVIAIEAAEGTDNMLRRVGDLRGTPHYPAPKRSGILIKAAKPQQELRNDMPVIGLGTVKNAIDAGLVAIAIESGHVLTADLPDMVTLANQNALAVVGVDRKAPRA